MNVKIKNLKNKQIDISLTCETCGEHISVTSVKFGMDCKNHCGERAYKKMKKNADPEMKAMIGFIESLAPKA